MGSVDLTVTTESNGTTGNTLTVSFERNEGKLRALAFVLRNVTLAQAMQRSRVVYGYHKGGKVQRAPRGK